MIALALASTLLSASASDPPSREQEYYAYVCAESDDTVQLVRFGPIGLEILKSIPVGSFPTEIEGPHGINVSPDGRFWFVSLAHGMPFGSVHKYATGSDEWRGDVRVGMFPATLAISPSTGLLFVVNFDLYGDAEPSTLSVVETSTMLEVMRIETGIMPHGARLDATGSRLYSVNMMGDELVEIDALHFQVSRRLALPALALDGSRKASVKPTWVTSPTAQNRVYVAGSGNDTLYEVNVDAWEVTRSFEAGPGPYNLDVSSDGQTLVTTYKKGAAIGLWNLESGEERARISTTRDIPHAAVITADDRYAFVTVEGIGGEPGRVEVYDLRRAKRVAALDVGKQAGGLALWSH